MPSLSLFRVFALGAVAVVLATGSLASIKAAEPTKKPNVVFIMGDDLGWADLGCYGSTYHATPRLDDLASRGLRFTNAYAAAPVCSPTRAAIMTGKWPAQLHLTDWLPGRKDMPSQRLLRPEIRQQLPLEEVTIAEAFSAAGYATGIVGKWHLGGPKFSPDKQGFQSVVLSPGPRYFAPWKNNQGVAPEGLEEQTEGEFLTDRCAAEAVKFIESHQDKPFFLYLPFDAPHIPMQAKADYIAKRPAAGEFAGRQNNPIYAAMLDSLDEAVGRVLDALDQAGVAENTIVVFTSDNGGLSVIESKNTPATSNAPLREAKGYLYEGGLRVPLIVVWPGKIKPGATDAQTMSIDHFPTLAAACGVPFEAPMDGVNMLPLWTSGAAVEREALYWHYPHYSNQGGKPGSAILSGDYKLIEFAENGRRELFNVAKDVSESRNLIEAEPQTAQRLAEMLAAWRTSIGAQLNTPNPDYKPNPQKADGSIVLPASTAEVHGVMLRFEPMPHKNTLGFWVNPKDYATWEFVVETPGEFDVNLLQGCGNGSGGSEFEIAVGEQKLTGVVKETGGFQKFESRVVGKVKIDAPGKHQLAVRALTKPGPAVMDIRQISLTPVK